METLVDIIMAGLLALVGGIPTLVLTLSVPVVLGWKIYRKFRYGYTLYQ